MAVPDDFVQRIGDRVLGLEGHNLGLTGTFDLRDLERLLQQQESGGDDRDATLELMSVDQVRQSGNRGVQPLVVARQSGGDFLDVELLEHQASRHRGKLGDRDVRRGEIDDGGLFLAHS